MPRYELKPGCTEDEAKWVCEAIDTSRGHTGIRAANPLGGWVAAAEAMLQTGLPIALEILEKLVEMGLIKPIDQPSPTS